MDTFWDPAGEKIDHQTFMVEGVTLQNKIQYYQNNPKRIKTWFIIWASVPILTILTLLLISVFKWDVEHFFDRLSINIIIFSFFPFFIYFGKIRQLQKELILNLLCLENQWTYNPSKDRKRTQLLAVNYPQIFQRGRDQYVKDQIWGSLDTGKKIDFWRGTFIYTQGHGKSSSIYTQAIFILRLEKNIVTPFALLANSLLTNGGQIKTESEEFNKLYSIAADEKDTTGKINIIKILSPSVQVRLIDFIHQFPILSSIDFQENSMAIVFGTEVWNPSYTNFFKKVTIDERDQLFFKEILQSMIAIPIEMMKFID